MNTLSQFFKMIRIHRHVGVSPSALRTQVNEMEVLLPQFQAECEKSIKIAFESHPFIPQC
ncbi:MAG: hypothetical protein KAG26_04250 [Methylococcales bacterium]|nr:hypothetical protein [Methylococcales bacterium]